MAIMGSPPACPSSVRTVTLSAHKEDPVLSKESRIFEVAIVGGGPAGMQAALVLARTRKMVVVFDDPQPPRNAASHGVHNFLGLDGLSPAEIRRVAWEQIDRYDSAELRHERIVDIRRDGDFSVINDRGDKVTARHVILALGYHDIHPNVPGFAECWGDTIIPCPFCDGYENRDRTWGIVGSSADEISSLPLMSQNWTSHSKVILAAGAEIDASYETQLGELNIPIHRGAITEIHHNNGKVRAVTLDSGERVEVGTLLWSPPEKPSPLVQNLVDNLGLELNEFGHVAANEMQQTNVDCLWAAGEVQGWTGAIESTYAGGMAAFFIVHRWYGEPKVD